MGRDPNISLQSLDEFVDSCIAFLKREQEVTPGLDLSNDIFDIEAVRQEALVNKYSRTIQP
jgi:hypothetical protein